MKQNDETEHNINAFVKMFDQEVATFKLKGIKAIVNYHASHFKDLLEFDDWKTAMKYLDENKEVVFKFLLEDHNES